jgi:hypothetical protein
MVIAVRVTGTVPFTAMLIFAVPLVVLGSM